MPARPLIRWLAAPALIILITLAAVVVVSGQPMQASVGGGKMYWTVYQPDPGKIQRANLDGSNVEDVVTGLTYPAGIDLDVGGGKMYWRRAGGIQRANLDGSNVETPITDPGLGDHFIALDPASGKMYWTDGGKIQRADLNGSNVENLVTGPIYPFGIDLDVAGGKMYWTAENPAGWIQRADLDGSDVQDLVSAPSSIGIALDHGAGKMYWGQLNGIWRANLDGSSPENLIPMSGEDEAFDVALDCAGGKIYWTDNGYPPGIRRANLDGSNVEDLFDGGSLWILWGIALDVPDTDCDGVLAPPDNCPTVFNTGQENSVHPGTPTGDACEDPDTDSVFDAYDNCPDTANPDQLNADSACIPNGADISGDCRANPDKDMEGDACDPDRDNDWMLDTGTNPILGIPGEDVGCGSGPTNPLKADSDDDTVVDGAECLLGSDPNNAGSKPPALPPGDGDRDGLPASVEALFGSSDSNPDTDGDGIPDGMEVKGWATSPTSLDTDGDSHGNDGCQDDKQIGDVNRDGQANILDVVPVARIALVAGSYDPVSKAAADINRDGANNILDVQLDARNSALVEPHAPC